MSDNAKFDEAVLWLSKQARPDFEWDAFTAWLETDVANRAAFDEASLIDDSLDRTLHLLEDAKLAANDNRRSWLGWVGGLGAAAAAAGIFLISPPGGHYPGATPVTSYVTKAGETRTVSLPNRVQVIIAPKSRLDVVGDHLTIDGEGYFAVTHVPARKLIVTAGAITISDIGTIFTADTGHGAPRVSVAEGKLAVTAGGDKRTGRLAK